MEVFAAYLAQIEPQQRVRVEEVFHWMGQNYPRLEPKIAWSQPMFSDHGTFIVGFSVSKKHLAVAPEKVVIERFAAEIAQAGYEHTPMLIRFPWDKPIDYALLAKLIDFNIADKASVTTFWRK